MDIGEGLYLIENNGDYVNVSESFQSSFLLVEVDISEDIHGESVLKEVSLSSDHTNVLAKEKINKETGEQSQITKSYADLDELEWVKKIGVDSN
jgi:hypothetical protein